MKREKVEKSPVDDRHWQIMRVAARMIALKGYRGTTIKNIASELKITAASIYYYYNSKADLLNHIGIDLPEPVENILKLCEYHMSPIERLRQIIIWLVMSHARFPEFSVIVYESERYLPKKSCNVIHSRSRAIHDVIQKALKDGIDQGLFYVNDVNLTTMAIFGMCVSNFPDSSEFVPEKLATNIISLLERGYINSSSKAIRHVIHSLDENVYPPEIENILIQHPLVSSVVVVPVPDPYWGEKVHAIVALKKEANVTDYELINFCKMRLSPGKVPKSVEFVDTLPDKMSREILWSKYYEGRKMDNSNEIKFPRVHHIGVVVKNLEKAIKGMESFGLGRFAHPTLPPEVEKELFSGKTFDTRYGPYIHPKMYQIIEVGPQGMDPALPPLAEPALYRGKPYNGNYRIFKIWLDDKILELIEPGKEPSPWKEHLDKKGEGIHHFAFNVDNLDMVTTQLKERGATEVFHARLNDGTGGDYLDLGFNIVVEIFQNYY